MKQEKDTEMTLKEEGRNMQKDHQQEGIVCPQCGYPAIAWESTCSRCGYILKEPEGDIILKEPKDEFGGPGYNPE